MKPLISVIVPVYNVKQYVVKCLMSIVGQDYENIEILVIDDGSTDGSGEICDEFVKKDKRVKVFHRRNGGLSDARNHGIEKASGDWIAFVDSDDYVNKRYISEMYDAARNDDADIVVCSYNNVELRQKVLSGEEAVIELLTKQENVNVVAWNKLYKKELFVRNGIYFPKGKIHEDTLTTYKVMSKARKVVYIAESLYEYVERESSIMGRGDVEERLKVRELAAKEALDYFRNNKNEEKAAMVALLLAKYAFLDNAITGKIKKQQGELARKWIARHRKELRMNEFVSVKLKIYILASVFLGGVVYRAFRKVVHE